MLGRLSAVLLIGFAQGAVAAPADFPDFPSSLSTSAAPVPGYGLDTSIQTLAANSACAKIVEANIPGLLEDGNYSLFKGMSLKTVASLSSGRISSETLQAIAGQLKLVPVTIASN